MNFGKPKSDRLFERKDCAMRFSTRRLVLGPIIGILITGASISDAFADEPTILQTTSDPYESPDLTFCRSG